MPSETNVGALVVGLTLGTALLGGGIGGACGWIGGTVLDEMGYDINGSDSFGYIGLIGGAEVALIVGASLLRSSPTSSSFSSLSAKQAYCLGFAAFTILAFTMGMIGMGQTLQFNDTVMSNLEQNERIWTSGAACATGAAVLYIGTSLVAAGALMCSEIKNKLSRTTN